MSDVRSVCAPSSWKKTLFLKKTIKKQFHRRILSENFLMKNKEEAFKCIPAFVNWNILQHLFRSLSKEGSVVNTLPQCRVPKRSVYAISITLSLSLLLYLSSCWATYYCINLWARKKERNWIWNAWQKALVAAEHEARVVDIDTRD